MFVKVARFKKTKKMNINEIRKDFPILSRKVYNKDLIYLDNGATTQKPLQVIDAVSDFYKQTNSNIHRGVHYLSDKSTEMYENARVKVQNFINAEHKEEVIFTRGTTDAVNLVAFSYGEKYIQEGDEVIITEMEHHSNIVPWQLLCERKKALLKYIPLNSMGELQLDELDNLLSERTKILAVTYVSNSLGTINPVKEIIKKAHKCNVPVLVDAAQAIQHISVDVQDLDCDFLAFSGHKMYAETGIGVLYGKQSLLDAMPPYQGGGDMVDVVKLEKTTYLKSPFRFEAGTTNYVGAISIAAAIDYINRLGISNIQKYEHDLLQYAIQQLEAIDNLSIYGNSKNKSAVTSFLLDGIHSYDTGVILDKMGIAVRTGTHCTQPVMSYFGISGTVRISFAMYNTFEEIDVFMKGIKRVQRMFG